MKLYLFKSIELKFNIDYIILRCLLCSSYICLLACSRQNIFLKSVFRNSLYDDEN